MLAILLLKFLNISKEGIKDFTSVKDLHQFLIKNNIIVKNEKKYEPHSSLEKAEVDKYFIENTIQGKGHGTKLYK